jgi:hypothetical protein
MFLPMASSYIGRQMNQALTPILFHNNNKPDTAG